jgi:outer membrane immunogenic protein
MKCAYFLVPLASLMSAAPAAAQNFDGFRVEGRLGYDWVSLKAEYEDSATLATSENDEDGLAFGGEIGYDFQAGPNVILGVYAGVDFSDTDFCRPIAGLDQGCLEVRRNFFIGARAGFQAGPSTLIYGKAGYSNGQARVELADVDDIVVDLVDSRSRDGWHFGAGVEQNFGPMFYGKLEFVYTIYSDVDFATPDYVVTLDGNRSQVIAGLGLRF